MVFNPQTSISPDPHALLLRLERDRATRLESSVSQLERERAALNRQAAHRQQMAQDCNADILATYQEAASSGSRLAEIRALLCEQEADDTPEIVTPHEPLLCWTASEDPCSDSPSDYGTCGEMPWESGRDSDSRACDAGAWKQSVNGGTVPRWTGDLPILLAMLKNVRAYA